MNFDDEVLSDVHLYCGATFHFQSQGQTYSECQRTQRKESMYKVLKSRFSYKRPRKQDVPCPDLEGGREAWSSCGHSDGLVLDEDGDIIVHRQKEEEEEDVIIIEHAMSTRLPDVGLQVWRGALLMCDFILHKGSEFTNKVVLELGAGTGLVSILLSSLAHTVYASDTGLEVLEMCKKNCEENKNLSSPKSEVKVRDLDWFQESFCQDPTHPYHWLEEDIIRLREDVILVAADVIYDEDLTEAFFRMVHKLMHAPPGKKLYISLEKRLNFTLLDLDVACPAYNHFQQCLTQLVSLSESSGVKYTVQQLHTDFPQYFQYEKTKYMELWQVTSSFKR